ncbi:hypothetical protein L3Q82_003387 [Scortum barcoo]|uniref:Uncharacterized protein n=1 Tax=Scortum barcoo TaxID=214431 RepID=A0ACB8VM78_9TELE|nr:hypothetical protein L3Q82_003387 [Scortum barcoo]
MEVAVKEAEAKTTTAEVVAVETQVTDNKDTSVETVASEKSEQPEITTAERSAAPQTPSTEKTEPTQMLTGAVFSHKKVLSQGV